MECQDTIWSTYPWEYVECGCGKIFIDSTPHYSRRWGDCILEIEEDDRDVILRGTRWKDLLSTIQFKPISKLSDDHIKAILRTQVHIKEDMIEALENELKFRSDNQIEIDD